MRFFRPIYVAAAVSAAGLSDRVKICFGEARALPEKLALPQLLDP